MFYLIIGIVVLIAAVIATTIQAWCMQLAFKIVTKETPTFGDAFKTCFVALIAAFLIHLGLNQVEMDVILGAIVGIGVNIVVFAVVISMFIATDLLKALIISAIMSALLWLLFLTLAMVLAALSIAISAAG